MILTSYAQNFEDVMLWRALGHVEHGFYIDVGAQRPDVDSVTRVFYERGWRGINIEPVQQWYRELVGQRPRDINLNVAAGRAAGELELNVFEGTGLSTAVDTYASEHEQSGFGRQVVRVPVRTLQSICDEYHVSPIHFLKIDVEGFEADVLAGIDFNVVRPWILVIEATLPNSKVTNYQVWEPLLLEAGYEFVYFDGLNRYYTASERSHLRESFSSPPNVFDDFALSGNASNTFSKAVLDRVRDAELESERAIVEREQAQSQLGSVRDELQRTVAELETHRRQADALVKPTAELQSRYADSQYELDIARKRLAADTRSLIAKDQRIQVLEDQLEVVRERWQSTLGDAVARLDAAMDGRLSGLAERDTARGREQAAIVDGVSRLESLMAGKLAAVEASLEDWRRKALDTSQELSRVRADLSASLSNAHHWYQAHTQVSDELSAREARLAAVLESNHQWFVRAADFEQALLRMERSRSWKVTSPLRTFRRVTVASVKAVARPPVLLVMRLLKRNPRLWALVSSRLKAHPRLFARLKASAVAANIVQASAYASLIASSSATPAASHGGREDVSTYQLRIRRRIRPGA